MNLKTGPTQTTNRLAGSRSQISIQQPVREMICRTIQTRKKFPTHQSGYALLVKKLFHGAGRLRGEGAGYTELNKAMTDDPWSPFSSENDFNLASWFIRRKVAKSHINAYFTEGLGSTDSRSFRSGYILRQHLDILDPFHEELV